MTMSVPLSVRVQSSRTDRDITLEVSRLQFRSAVPRGFASCTMYLHRPLRQRPDEIEAYSKVYVYDCRNGATVWEGLLEDPERTSSAAGELWGLAAIGPASIADDQTVPLIYVDKSVERWVRGDNTMTKTYLTTAQDQKSESSPGWRLSVERGKTAQIAELGGIEYRPIRDSGQKFGRISFTYDVDNADGNWLVKLFMIDSGGNNNPLNVAFSAGDGSTAKIVGTDFANGRERARLQMTRITSSVAIATDDGNVWFTNIVVRSLLHAVDGSERLVTGSALQNYAYSTDTILAEDVIRDLIGVYLTKIDTSRISIAASTYAIDQLAYYDGTTPGRVMDDLMLLEPNTFWAIWESTNLTNTLYRFEWSTWPTSIDYDTTIYGGFDSPGSSVDLYNRVNVRWRTADGAVNLTTRTQTVQALTDAGRTRTAFIDLGNEVGSLAGAQRAGDNFLANHSTPPNRGTIRINRPIVSRSEGRMVQPWELRPGRLLIAQDIEPSVDALNTTARNGVSVFRVVAVDYDSDTNTATLELDNPARSNTHDIASVLGSPVLDQRRR